MKFVRISSLIIGLCMIFQWVFFLTTGQVPELETAPISIVFHIVIELITACVLIAVFFLLKTPRPGRTVFAAYGQGMLGYTVVNSAGYFAQSGDWIFLMMFAVLLFFSLGNLSILINNKASSG
jgi:hypothetical protein